MEAQYNNNMQLYYIRHAQSTNNALWAEGQQSQEGRSDDPGLTELGKQQAELLAFFLKESDPVFSFSESDEPDQGFGITHLYCSPMIRAVETGNIVSRSLGIPLAAWIDLHEFGGMRRWDEESKEYISLSGEGKAYYETNYPDLVLPPTFPTEGWWDRPPEEPEEAVARGQRVLAELLGKDGGADHRVAMISHGAFFKFFIVAILGMESADNFWFNHNNTGITSIIFEEEWLSVHYVNRVDFLSPEMIT